MARHQVMICDVCKKPTDRIVGKISFVPSVPGVVRLNWNNYTHVADVGECCSEKLFEDIDFRKRMTKTEYARSRNSRANRSTVRTKKA